VLGFLGGYPQYAPYTVIKWFHQINQFVREIIPY